MRHIMRVAALAALLLAGCGDQPPASAPAAAPQAAAAPPSYATAVRCAWLADWLAEDGKPDAAALAALKTRAMGVAFQGADGEGKSPDGVVRDLLAMTEAEAVRAPPLPVECMTLAFGETEEQKAACTAAGEQTEPQWRALRDDRRRELTQNCRAFAG